MPYYRVRQKAGGDRFAVFDSNDNEVFRVTGKLFRVSDHLIMKDGSGKECLTMKGKTFSISSRYDFYRNGKLYATLNQVAAARKRFEVAVTGGQTYDIAGDFEKLEYSFTAGDEKVIATVAKDNSSWMDSYQVSILEGDNETLIIACAVVMDLIHCNEN